MTAQIIGFDQARRAARERRDLPDPIQPAVDRRGALVPLPRRPRRNRFVQVLESRTDGRWLVFGIEDWREERFADLISAMTYAHAIAGPAHASVEVYRRDRELSA